MLGAFKRFEHPLHVDNVRSDHVAKILARFASGCGTSAIVIRKDILRPGTFEHEEMFPVTPW